MQYLQDIPENDADFALFFKQKSKIPEKHHVHGALIHVMEDEFSEIRKLGIKAIQHFGI